MSRLPRLALMLVLGCGPGDAGSGLETETETEHETDVEHEHEAETDVEHETETEHEAETDVEHETETDVEHETETDAEHEHETEDAQEVEVSPPLPACVDLIEEVDASRWSAVADDGHATTVTVLGDDDALFGSYALRADTGAPFAWTLTRAGLIDAREASELAFAVRALNTNSPTWQGAFPVVSLVDGAGRRLTWTPTREDLLPSDGATWRMLTLPFAGDATWSVARDGDFDAGDVQRFTLSADTWGAGFVIDLDGLALVSDACARPCPCGPRGACDPASTTMCACELGHGGDRCERCAPGFVADGDDCRLARDGDYDVWPNPVARAASDPWLAVHHQDIVRIEPIVLVLDFVNVSTPTATRALIDTIIAGFAEGSRERGDALPTEPALAYRLFEDRVVDLRDGVGGRPPAPIDWPHDNSTLYPRRAPGAPGAWTFDYAALYGEAFARLYGVVDPADSQRYLTLCGLAERGLVHEVWVVGSGDVPDVNAAEVLEHKARWDAQGNRLPGFDACAGNGCFDPDVPRCEVSLRVGWVNYNRGPGCYLHSQGHMLESIGQRPIVPALVAWLSPFAGLDLDARWGLPFASFYGVHCASPPCIDHPTPGSLEVRHGDATHTRDPFDAVCGNVHFPPNAEGHYDYTNPGAVSSSCATYGRGDVRQTVTTADWADNTPWPDCGGEFLVWWMQRMPGPSGAMRHPDGRAMPSLWPFLFY